MAEETDNMAVAQTEEKPKVKLTIARLQKAYPDKDFSAMSEDEIDALTDGRMGELEDYQGKNNLANQDIAQVMQDFPEIAMFFADMKSGMPPHKALIKNIPLEDLTPESGSEDEGFWKEQIEGRRKQREDADKMLAELADNEGKSVMEIQEFAKENNMTEEQAIEFLNKVDEFLAPIQKGLVTKDFLSKMKKGLEFDDAVKMAEESGKIAGKNEAVTVVKMDKKVGDGLPQVSGGGGEMPVAEKNTNEAEASFVEKLRAAKAKRMV